MALKCTDGYEVRLKSHAIWHAQVCEIALSGGFLILRSQLNGTFPWDGYFDEKVQREEENS
jgi:hypothetical protein